MKTKTKNVLINSGDRGGFFMNDKPKEKVYAERQHNYKTKKEEIFKKALDSVPTTDKKKEEQKKKA